MGQYYKIVNLDKKQYLYPHRFGDGIKLIEFSTSRFGTLMALSILLSQGNGRGGGDIRSEHPLVGSWAGDRIVAAGDYADEMEFVDEKDIERWKENYTKENEEVPKHKPNLYEIAAYVFKNISEEVVEAICQDAELADVLSQMPRWDKSNAVLEGASEKVYDPEYFKKKSGQSAKNA